MAKKSNKAVIAAEVGAGLAAAAAAGYYFYASKNAKQHRKAAAKWADGLKREVLKEAKRLKQMDAKTIARAVDTAAAAYAAARSIDAAELKRATKELKANWELVKREAAHGAKKAGKSARASVAKTVKRVEKKAKAAKKRAR